MSKQTLRIGLDFDNTLICYDQVFYQLAREHRFIEESVPAKKANIRQSIVERFGNDLHWQKLQSLAYGPQISEAQLFDGVLAFVSVMIKQGHELFIVSHKSVRSHFNPNIKLRDHALSFMKQCGLVAPEMIPEQHVFFAQTLTDKVEKIANLKLDVFVDDLGKVLLHECFPQYTVGIKYNGSKTEGALYADDWQQISHYIDRLKYLRTRSPLSKCELTAFLKCFNVLPNEVETLKRDGNNQIYQVSSGQQTKVVLKRYYQSSTDNRNRAQVEFGTLFLLNQHQFKQVPKAIYKHQGDAFAFYQCLDGSVPNSSCHEKQVHLAKEISAFVQQLKRFHDSNNMSEQPLAADARQSFKDYFSKIDQRLSTIIAGCRDEPRLNAVKQFAIHRLLPFKAKLFSHVKGKIASLALSEAAEFSVVSQTLNPSDLGPHNMIESDAGQLFFIDFEYFGLDDPAKMLADLFHHAQEKLSHQACWFIYQNYIKEYPDIEIRFAIVNDLIAFEWLLIMLNVANPDALQRRLFANPGLDVEALIEQRLTHAQERFNHYLSVSKQGGEFLTLSETSQLNQAEVMKS